LCHDVHDGAASKLQGNVSFRWRIGAARLYFLARFLERTRSTFFAGNLEKLYEQAAELSKLTFVSA
jgi:hypothetical protein